MPTLATNPHTFRTNPEVAHAWIYASLHMSTPPQEVVDIPVRARNPTGSLYYEGNAIYSYGPHYPIAVRISPYAILMTHESSSVTTAKHRILVRQAANHLNILHIPCISDPEIMTADSLASDLLGYAQLHAASIAALPNRAYRKIYGESTKLQYAIDGLQYLSISTTLSLPTRNSQHIEHCYTEARNLQYELDADPAYQEAINKARFPAARRTSDSNLSVAIQRWRDGKRSSVPNHRRVKDYDLLRLSSPATVLTSQGISLDAHTVYTFLKALFEHVPNLTPQSSLPATAESGIDQRWYKLPDDLPALGPYRATYIGERGDVKVGCHTFPASEIWDLYDALQTTPPQEVVV